LPEDGLSPETSQLSNLLLREEADSEGSVCSDTGDWEPVGETMIAVDYSNVHVFLKTLHDWQATTKSQQPRNELELQVNLDETLCQKVFAADDPSLTESQVADLLYQGGYISLDPPATESAHPSKKRTWYKTEVEPCVGTSLFLEIPLCRVN